MVVEKVIIFIWIFEGFIVKVFMKEDMKFFCFWKLIVFLEFEEFSMKIMLVFMCMYFIKKYNWSMV